MLNSKHHVVVVKIRKCSSAAHNVPTVKKVVVAASCYGGGFSAAGTKVEGTMNVAYYSDL